MRIALAHPFSWPAVRRGGERYLADLAWYLRGAGHEVDVITGGDANGSTPTRRVRLVEPRWLARRGISAVETFGVTAFPHLVRRRYDVVHALTPTAAIAARAAGQRTVYTILGHPAAELVARFPRLQRVAIQRAVRSAHAVAALSRPSAVAAEAVFGRAAEVLPPGVRLDAFPLEAGPRTGPPRILFPAFAGDPNKGLETLADAFALLRDEFPDARLVLAGPGDASPVLAKVPAVNDAVDQPGVGPIEDLPALYGRATATALPSTYEAFGLVLVESLACGTPVVCSSTATGSTDIVTSSGIGRAVPFGDAPALAGALRDVITLARDPDTAARCRAHAIAWDWQTSIGPAHERLYGRVVSGRSARR